jgi:RNA polymerase sigma factor (sigma-70 family)
MAEETLDRLAAELNSGRDQTLTHILGAMGRFRGYTWDNALLIAAQRPDASRVATMHAWKDLGREVKEGEKGVLIFAPITEQQKTIRSPALPGHDPLRRSGSRAMYIYDLSQTDGEPVPEFAPRITDSNGSAERVKAMVASHGLDEPHAELVAYVVSRGLGIETHAAAAESMAAYADDTKALAQRLAVIHDTSAQILDELIPKETTTGARLTALREEPPHLDAESFGRMHRQYRDRLVYSMTELVRNHAKAEDIAAQAFRAAWANRHEFRGHALPYTWLQAIARNLARRTASRERIIQFESVDGEEARQLAAPELVMASLEKRDDGLQLQKALERLPEKHRRALTARFVDGLSIREIALREHVPIGTVLSRIHKGKQLLRRAWDSPLSVPPAEAPARGTLSPKPEERRRLQALEPSARERLEPQEPVTWDR